MGPVMIERIGFIADVHVANHAVAGGEYKSGLNERCRHILDALAAAVTTANHEKLSRLVVLGDLFDSHRPTPQMVAAVGDILGGADMPVALLRGNHDMTTESPGHHAMAPLRMLTGCTIVEKPYVHSAPGGATALALVPFQTGPAKETLAASLKLLESHWPRSTEPKRWQVQRLLGIHYGIHDQAMRDSIPGGWVEKANDAIAAEHLVELCREHGITACFAGNWHSYRSWSFFDMGQDRDIHICQAGTIAPTGWNNPGLENYGRLVIWDSLARKTTTMEVPGPRFINVGSVAEIQPILEELDSAMPLYVRRTVGPGEAVAAGEELSKVEGLAGWDVRVDKAAAVAQAQKAAASARSAETLDSSLLAYVAEMPLDDDIQRDRIFNMAKGYLT